MKKLLFAVFATVLFFGSSNISYGYESLFNPSSSMVFENEKNSNFLFENSKQENSNEFWLNSRLAWLDSAGESCSLRDQYGECSVTCDGNKKAVCKPGYYTGMVGFGGVKYYPPKCYCQ